MVVRWMGSALVALLLAACSAPAGGAGPRSEARDEPATPAVATREPATPEPSPEPEGWRKPRYIPVREAVERLARHVDVPVVLPRDPLSIRSYRRWLADPKYLTWERRGDETVGRLKLVFRRDYLLIDYGYAIPDGCGGRDTAIPTEVLGEPALVWTGHGSSSIIWPVKPHGRIGRFGLSGPFEGFQIVRLARSMETAIRGAPRHDPGC